MEFDQVRQVSPGRVIGDAVLALAIGALLPVIALLQISLLVPVLMLGGIFAAHLRARSGWAPAGALFAAATACAAWLMGIQMALILLAASLMPAVPVMARLPAKQPFFKQLNGGVIAFAAGLIAATAIAYTAFGGSMVARFVDLLRAEYDRMPDATLQPLVEWVNSMLSVGALQQAQLMTVDAFRAQINGVLDLMQQTYAQALPGALLSGAMLSGVLCVLWANWTMARQGMATNESFVGMSGWFLPPRISLGALGLWLVGLVLMYAGYASGATVYLAIGQMVGALFAIQALSALDRRMLQAGRSLSRRRVLIVLLGLAGLLFRGIGSLLCYIGVASSMVGSHGAIRLWMKKRQDDHSDHDDFDE